MLPRFHCIAPAVSHLAVGPALLFQVLDATCSKTRLPTVEAPVSYDFHDTTVFKTGPWGQGPVALQTLSQSSRGDPETTVQVRRLEDRLKEIERRLSGSEAA